MHFINLTSSFPAMPQEAQRDDASSPSISELIGNNDSKQQLISWELARVTPMGRDGGDRFLRSLNGGGVPFNLHKVNKMMRELWMASIVVIKSSS